MGREAGTIGTPSVRRLPPHRAPPPSTLVPLAPPAAGIAGPSRWAVAWPLRPPPAQLVGKTNGEAAGRWGGCGRGGSHRLGPDGVATPRHWPVFGQVKQERRDRSRYGER